MRNGRTGGFGPCHVWGIVRNAKVAHQAGVLKISYLDKNKMHLVINGERKELASLGNLSKLVQSLQLKPDRIAVELNREIVPRANWETTDLRDGDSLEVVHFVGGGSR